MKGTAKRKVVVTSGRLTGGVRVQPARRRVTPNPGPAAGPEPAYSLYSTDSEDQVTTLHKGLDRCAALLGDLLQADGTELTPPGPLRALKGGAAKSRSATLLGKKTNKKPPTKTDQKSSPSVQRVAGGTTPRTPHPFCSPAAHSGVTLHPPQKRTRTPLQSHVSPSQSQTCQPPYPTLSQPQPSVLISVSQSNSQTDCQPAPTAPHTEISVSGPHEASCDREQDDSVPVRDINTQSSAPDPQTHSHTHTCTMKMSDLPPQPGPAEEDSHSGEEEAKQRTVQYLLGELKALIVGQGSVAERLLSHLEQTVSSPLMDVSSSNSPADAAADLQSLHIQNTQLRRHVRILNQQLNEREEAERQRTLCESQALTLQEELTSAQSQLQELQDDLAELRNALQDRQSQLRDREAENALMKTDLEATRSRLLHSEREKSELASLVQQRLEEIEHLNRILQDSSAGHTLVDNSVSDTPPTKQHFKQQHRQDPPEPPASHIAQYLMSLDQLEPPPPTRTHTHTVAAEKEGNTAEEKKPRETSSLLVGPDEVQAGGRQPGKERRRLFNSTLSRCDVESVTSDWSVMSGSSFDTRDEAAFRDGLAALDASIASLQKTIKVDLGR